MQLFPSLENARTRCMSKIVFSKWIFRNGFFKMDFQNCKSSTYRNCELCMGVKNVVIRILILWFSNFKFLMARKMHFKSNLIYSSNFRSTRCQLNRLFSWKIAARYTYLLYVSTKSFYIFTILLDVKHW